MVSLGPCTLHTPVSGRAPCEAVVVGASASLIQVALPPGAHAPGAGERVVLDGPAWRVRVQGTVELSGDPGGHVAVRVTREIEKDRRAAVRHIGGIDMRYALAGEQARAESWLAGDLLEVTWHVPDPFMSFSSTGLRFDHRAVVEEGDVILLGFTVPKRKDSWRGTARVVRVTALAPDEQNAFMEGEPAATHRIAVHFETLSVAARDALVERGLEIMKALRRL